MIKSKVYCFLRQCAHKQQTRIKERIQGTGILRNTLISSSLSYSASMFPEHTCVFKRRRGCRNINSNTL